MAHKESIGDCSIMDKRPEDGKDCRYTVRFWGLRWYCTGLDNARQTAELLNKLAGVCRDVSQDS